MDKDLPRLIRELRNESCPERVFVEAARRISAQTPPPRRIRYSIRAALAGLALLCCWLLWQWQAPPHTEQRSHWPAPAAASRTEVAQQAKNALAFIGGVLVEAGDRSQKAIFDQAAPPLRNSLDTATDKTINRIKL